MKHHRLNTNYPGLTLCTCWLVLFGACQSGQGAGSETNQALVIECRGTVKPRHEMILRLRPGEQVLDVRVVQKEKVKAGSPLVEIYDGEASSQLRELKAQQRLHYELDSKTSRLNHLEEDLASQLQLWKEIEPDAAERRVAGLREKRDELKEQVELLKMQSPNADTHVDTNRPSGSTLDAQIHLLETRLGSPLIAAPFDGQIVYCAAAPDQLATGETLLEVWDTNLIVRAEILQHQLEYVSEGCRAEVTLDFSDEKPVGAIVEDVDLRPETHAGETSPVFGVELALDKVAHQLKAGMRVSVRILSEKPKTE